MREINEQLNQEPPPPKITQEELNKAIKSLKRNKATGPDGIPNEAIIEASETTREMYLEVINTILQNRKPPEQWQKGHIKRLYKGKGIKGKCSNERGITLGSNMGKLYERIINNRALEQIKTTQSQV